MAGDLFLNPAAAVAMSTGLGSIANNARALGSDVYDNSLSANRYDLATFELVITYGVAPTANSLLPLSLIYAPDGTNYVSGDSSRAPQSHLRVGAFEVQATTSAQRLYIYRVPIDPFKLKVLLENATGQTLPSSITLNMYPIRSNIT